MHFDDFHTDLIDDGSDALFGVDLSDLSPSERAQWRVDRLGRARARTMVLAREIEGIAPLVAGRLRQCGQSLLVRHFHTSGDVSFQNYNSCNIHLLCGVCAIRRSLRLMSMYLTKYKIIRDIFYDLSPVFLTFTVKNGQELLERFGHLEKSLAIMKKRRSDALRGRRSVELGKVAGWLGSYEIIRGSRSGLWHPHVHCLALADASVSADALAADWRAVTGDSHVVDARIVTGEPIRAFCEVFKYSMKFSELAPADAWQARQDLVRRRLMFSAGVFRASGCPEAHSAVLASRENVRGLLADQQQSRVVYEFGASGYSVNQRRSRF